MEVGDAVLILDDHLAIDQGEGPPGCAAAAAAGVAPLPDVAAPRGSWRFDSPGVQRRLGRPDSRMLWPIAAWC
jgi:hypothetical protein